MATLEPTRESYYTWKESIFGSGYAIYHDGLPVENVTRLTGSARDDALKMLHFGLSLSPPDSHAASALSALGDTNALPSIRTMLQTAGPKSKVELAKAVIRLSPSDEAVKDEMATEICFVLVDRSGHWGERIDAAMALRDFDDVRSESILEEGVIQDPEYLVRYHCVESLLFRRGVKPATISRTKHKDVFGLICGAREGDGDTRNQVERGEEALKLLRALKKH